MKTLENQIIRENSTVHIAQDRFEFTATYPGIFLLIQAKNHTLVPIAH